MPARSPENNPKITLRFGGQKAGGSSGVSVDSEALRRQQDLVNAGVNGQGIMNTNGIPRSTPINSFTSQVVGSRPPNIPSQESTRSASAERSASMNGVKNEIPLRHSPALSAVQLNRELNRSSESIHSHNPSAAVMPPPSSVTPRIASHSPHLPVAASATSADSRLRQSGKGGKQTFIVLRLG